MTVKITNAAILLIFYGNMLSKMTPI